MESTRPYMIISIVVTVVILFLVFWFGPEGIPFLEFTTADVMRLVTSAILIALFIERTTEVILVAWRGQRRAELVRIQETAMQGKRAEGKKDDALLIDPDVKAASEELEDYKAKSRRIALLTAFALGVIISALGVRLIEPLLDPDVIGEIEGGHRRLLAGIDVFITGALLGGGANGLHRILDLFLSAVDTNRHDRKQKNPMATQ